MISKFQGVKSKKLFMELDNQYATRKTVAQGLLDVALLTTNATQLRFILSLEDNHEFYELVLTLIILSILLQVNYS